MKPSCQPMFFPATAVHYQATSPKNIDCQEVLLLTQFMKHYRLEITASKK